MAKVKEFFSRYLHLFIVAGVALLCTIFILVGVKSDSGYITLDGKDATVEESTKKFIEDSQAALYRIMNEDDPTDEAIVKEYENGWEGDEGLGGSTTLEAVIGRRRPDGDNDNGAGWQCSKYTAYLATGKKDYSSAHPDYGPVNGKNIAAWLVKNFGWKYTDTPVTGAIGSGGFNTLYGHTAMYLYSTGSNTAMVNDANYVPLTVATHNMNIDGWVWVVPGDYTPDPEPTPTPSPTPSPISDCKTWTVVKGNTISSIMKTCNGSVDWANINSYADKWISQKVNPGKSVYWGWTHGTGYGLYIGDVIQYSE